MSNQVTNTAESFNCNFIFIANIANVLYETTRGARWDKQSVVFLALLTI